MFTWLNNCKTRTRNINITCFILQHIACYNHGMYEMKIENKDIKYNKMLL